MCTFRTPIVSRVPKHTLLCPPFHISLMSIAFTLPLFPAFPLVIVLEPETIGFKVVHLITNGLTMMCRWQKSYQTFAAAQLQK